MKKIEVILLVFICVVLALTSNAQTGSENVMKYRMALVDPADWMSSKEADKAYVRRLADMIVSDGYNTIMLGPINFPATFLVDYSQTPYPEAAQLSSEKVKSNVETLRANIRYAKSKGIKYFITRSYSMYAPYPFWKAHQKELNPDNIFHNYLLKAHQSDRYKKIVDGKIGSTDAVPHQQWNNKTYRDFYIYSFEKVLDQIPELDGFNTAFAEVSWIVDIDKMKAGASDKDCRDNPATVRAFIDFAQTLHDIIKRKRGKDGICNIREWYMTEEVLSSLQMPKDEFIITCRYGGFDQPIVNYPPWAEDLIKKGYQVVLDFHSYDGEYPKPVYFYDVRLYNEMFAKIRKAGFNGVCQLDYLLRGEDEEDNPIRRLTLMHVGKVMQGKPFSEADAEAFLKPYYGKASQDIIKSMTAATLTQEYYIKLQPAWFWYGDGLTPGGPNPQAYWMFASHPDAPERMGFVRQDVISLKEYVDVAVKGDKAIEQAENEWKRDRKLSPVAVIEFMNQQAEIAVNSILRAREQAPKSIIMQDLVASAYVNKLLAERNSLYIRSAISFYMSGYVYDGKFNTEKGRINNTGIDLSKECIALWNDFMKKEMLLRKVMAEYSPRRRGLTSKLTYGYPKQIFSILKEDFVIPSSYDEQEFRHLSNIITNKK